MISPLPDFHAITEARPFQNPTSISYILYHRVVVNSMSSSAVMKIDSMIAEFNQDLSDFHTTLAVIATWHTIVDNLEVRESTPE